MFYLALHINGHRPQGLFKVWPFEYANTVLARQCAAHSQRSTEFFRDHLLDFFPLLRLALIEENVGVEIPVPGMTEDSDR